LDLPSWETAADVDEELVDLLAGGTEMRYACGGTLVYDGAELEQMIQPILDAAASQLVWVNGKAGVAPGAARTPLQPITDFMGDEVGALSFTSILDPEETATALTVR